MGGWEGPTPPAVLQQHRLVMAQEQYIVYVPWEGYEPVAPNEVLMLMGLSLNSNVECQLPYESFLEILLSELHSVCVDPKKKK